MYQYDFQFLFGLFKNGPIFGLWKSFVASSTNVSYGNPTNSLYLNFHLTPYNLYNGSCPRYVSKVLYHVQNYFLNDFNKKQFKIKDL